MALRQAACYLVIALCTGHLIALRADAACTGKLTDLQSTAGIDGFSLFYQGLVAVNASDIINNTSTLTLLAPTDAAFSAGMVAIGLPVSPSNWNAAETNLARGILFYHILPGQPGKFLNRSNPAELRKTLVSKVDTFVCGPGSVDIPLNDTDPIDNISAVTLDFSNNSTTAVIGIYKNATANATEYTDACFTGISIYLLNGLILPCNTNSPCALSSTVSDDLMGPGLPTLAPLIGKQIPEQMANGTILLPTDAALNATLKAIMSLVGTSAAATTTTTDPAAIMLSLPQFKDVLAYHIIAGVNIGETPTTGNQITLLKSYKQSFCTAQSAGTVKVTRTTSGNITITDAIGTVANATLLGESCNGIVWEIDAVLLPCRVMDSIIAAFVKAPTASPAKTSPAPGSSPAASPKAGTSPAPGSSPAPTTGAGPMTTPGAWTAVALAASLVVLLLSH